LPLGGSLKEETMIRHIQPKAVPESAAPFSQIVMDGTYAHFAGLVAADFPEGQAVLGDVGKETRAVLNVIRSMLEEIGLDMDRVVRTDVHIASFDDFDAMDDAYREFFKPGGYPARTTTESPRLFHGSSVEITCMARLL
jgi:2-iminobutanoate/2-iminopropanoate deaminase